jgi:hypothetical protein
MPTAEWLSSENKIRSAGERFNASPAAVLLAASFCDGMTAKKLRISVVVVSVFLFTLQVIAFSRGVPVAIGGRADFRSLYIAGYMVRTSQAHNLYDYESNWRFQDRLATREGVTRVFDAPAYEALLFVPFSYLNYRLAYIAFFGANLALLALSIRTLRPYLDTLERVWRWLPVAVFVCFFPVTAALIQGHDSIVLLTLTLISAAAFYRGRDVRAGVFLGLTLFKFQLAVPIALLFLFWRRWRMIGAFSVTVIVLMAVSLSLAGVEGLRVCTRDLLSWNPQQRALEWLNVINPASAMPNLRCLFQALASTSISTREEDWAAVGCSILLLVWTATRTANFALGMLVALLISAHGTIYDAVLLVLPTAMVLDARLTVSTGISRLWSRNIAIALFVTPSLLFLAGTGYCLLTLLMLAMLMPLRFTSSNPFPSRLAPKLSVHIFPGCT